MLWFWLGMILLPLTMIPLLLVLGKDIDTVGKVGRVICFAQVVPMVGAIFPTELALRKNFDKNGKRRNT